MFYNCIRTTQITSNFILTVLNHLLQFYNTRNYYFASIHLYNITQFFDNQYRFAIISCKYLQLLNTVFYCSGKTLFVLALTSDRVVLFENVVFSILVLSTTKRYSSFLKRVCVFQKICFKVKGNGFIQGWMKCIK